MKILLTSDWHKDPFKKDKFKTQKPNWIEKIIIWLTSSKKKMACVFERLAEIIREKEIDLVINDGDMMENPQNERGLVTREGITTAKEIRRSFCGKNHIHMELNAGNHELGYRLPLSTDALGGMSIFSIRGFQELAGTTGESLCRSFSYRGFRIVLLPFGFAQESATGFDIEDFKEELIADLEKNFGGFDRMPVLLFLHDPEALSNNRLFNTLKNNRGKIARIFCGHWHAQWNFWPNWLLVKIFNSWWLYLADLLIRLIIVVLSKSFHISREVKRDFQKFKEVPGRMRELDITIIPAPLGMLGLGGGFLILDLETMEIQKFKA